MRNVASLLPALAFVLASPAAFAQADLSLSVGGKKLQASGEGVCKAAQQASIYGIPAALYTVSQRTKSHSLNLSLWQPKDGAPLMMSLSVQAGDKTYRVDTVKGGNKRDTQGSGKAGLEKSGAGGTIALDAVAASGEKITGTIKCRSFGGIQAEGG